MPKSDEPRIAVTLETGLPPERELAYDASADPDAGGTARDLPIWTPDQIADHLNRSGFSWSAKEIADGVKRTLEGTPAELAADIVDRGIVMTGGGSLLRGLDLYLREKTNLPINVVEDPLTCVVLGAGKVLDDIERYEKVLLRRVRR